MGPIKPITGVVCVKANIAAAINALKTGSNLLFRLTNRFAYFFVTVLFFNFIDIDYQRWS
ncbi:MAG: hypothetical protein ACQCN3_00435 [Candidatus Bathyarchaeia archaeon]